MNEWAALWSLRSFPREEDSWYLLISPDLNLVSLLIRQSPSCGRNPSNSQLCGLKNSWDPLWFGLCLPHLSDYYSHIHTNIYFPFAWAITLLKSLSVKSGLCNYFSRKLAFCLLLGLAFGQNGNCVLGPPGVRQALGAVLYGLSPAQEVRQLPGAELLVTLPRDPRSAVALQGRVSLPDLRISGKTAWRLKNLETKYVSGSDNFGSSLMHKNCFSEHWRGPRRSSLWVAWVLEDGDAGAPFPERLSSQFAFLIAGALPSPCQSDPQDTFWTPAKWWFPETRVTTMRPVVLSQGTAPLSHSDRLASCIPQSPRHELLALAVIPCLLFILVVCPLRKICFSGVCVLGEGKVRQKFALFIIYL